MNNRRQTPSRARTIAIEAPAHGVFAWHQFAAGIVMAIAALTLIR